MLLKRSRSVVQANVAEPAAICNLVQGAAQPRSISGAKAEGRAPKFDWTMDRLLPHQSCEATLYA